MEAFPVLALPAELKRRTASYLSQSDAISLSETCRNLHLSLSLRLLRNSRQLFVRQHFDAHSLHGDRCLPYVRIPCVSRRVHSITVTFRWHDQGWGHRKGQVFIVGHPRHVSPDRSRPYHGGRVVCTSGHAPHDEGDCKLTFVTSSMEGEAYQMWYRVGGGGGHRLYLNDGRLHTVIYDDEQGNVSRNYKILYQVGAIGVVPEADVSRFARSTAFYPQLLLRVSMGIRAELILRARNNKNGETMKDVAVSLDTNPLVSFFQMYQIPVTLDSLAAVEEIIQADLEEQALSQHSSSQPETHHMDVATSVGNVMEDIRQLLMGFGIPAPHQFMNVNFERGRFVVEHDDEEDEESEEEVNDHDNDDDLPNREPQEDHD